MTQNLPHITTCCNYNLCRNLESQQTTSPLGLILKKIRGPGPFRTGLNIATHMLWWLRIQIIYYLNIFRWKNCYPGSQSGPVQIRLNHSTPSQRWRHPNPSVTQYSLTRPYFSRSFKADRVARASRRFGVQGCYSRSKVPGRSHLQHFGRNENRYVQSIRTLFK